DHEKRGKVMLKYLSLPHSGNVTIGCFLLGFPMTGIAAIFLGLPRLLSKRNGIHGRQLLPASRKYRAYVMVFAMPTNPEKGQYAITNRE
ncbi:hypothetical protein B0T09DRAFT_250255, partial [Sordaria sp. MPI-SDFR-AT-0083]